MYLKSSLELRKLISGFNLQMAAIKMAGPNHNSIKKNPKLSTLIYSILCFFLFKITEVRDILLPKKLHMIFRETHPLPNLQNLNIHI